MYTVSRMFYQLHMVHIQHTFAIFGPTVFSMISCHLANCCCIRDNQCDMSLLTPCVHCTGKQLPSMKSYRVRSTTITWIHENCLLKSDSVVFLRWRNTIHVIDRREGLRSGKEQGLRCGGVSHDSRSKVEWAPTNQRFTHGLATAWVNTLQNIPWSPTKERKSILRWVSCHLHVAWFYFHRWFCLSSTKIQSNIEIYFFRH